MTDDITNKMLLEHMQAMKGELLMQIAGVKSDLQQQIGEIKVQLADLTIEVRQGFEDARQHRQALQEDLEATMRLQGKHSATLARLTRAGSR